ncbi:ubiquinol-cytochrome c reductase iron-sulfur subunit [Ktedonosporobacter rubrisoli]|uniref:Ubiquinol-cytochrome c reductase iron-sulfur subunit n=1 Tax=Ktedonosporobacter rubrisoli TaxID=2509675 RepID=A0A4P6JTS8_KTERU|nr:ubiquinol-cytochrome c reductase iron-sulfur subunit [Ktedonosporobacter rubrisoli]QBD78999.1 ubiquinol-cytochrome c reductase iron-sulfur subunit [Ktedonosporobacter rubrisoli]
MIQEVDPQSEATKQRRSTGEANPPARRNEEWREEFPYPWDEDEIVTRRDTLRFLLGGSGALFAATGILAILGNLPKGPDVQAVPVAKLGELKENEWKVFDFPDQYAQGILINLPRKGLVAYSDVCTHLSCAVVYRENGTLHCPCHEGLFDASTGNVLAGPPTRPLPLIELAIEGDTIYAVKVVPR